LPHQTPIQIKAGSLLALLAVIPSFPVFLLTFYGARTTDTIARTAGTSVSTAALSAISPDRSDSQEYDYSKDQYNDYIA
jgi:hypothetical protein